MRGQLAGLVPSWTLADTAADMADGCAREVSPGGPGTSTGPGPGSRWLPERGLERKRRHPRGRRLSDQPLNGSGCLDGRLHRDRVGDSAIGHRDVDHDRTWRLVGGNANLAHGDEGLTGSAKMDRDVAAREVGDRIGA